MYHRPHALPQPRLLRREAASVSSSVADARSGIEWYGSAHGSHTNASTNVSSAMASLMVDHFPRNIFLSIGVAGCMVTLIIHAALVAQFGESDNEPALQAAVAMLFIFEIPYDWCLDGA